MTSPASEPISPLKSRTPTIMLPFRICTAYAAKSEKFIIWFWFSLMRTLWFYSPDRTATTRFATTPMMSTYLIYFTIADCRHINNPTYSKFPIRIRAIGGADNFTKIRLRLDEGELAIKYLEKYLQVPKTDQIVSASHFDGMENLINISELDRNSLDCCCALVFPRWINTDSDCHVLMNRARGRCCGSLLPNQCKRVHFALYAPIRGVIQCGKQWRDGNSTESTSFDDKIR